MQFALSYGLPSGMSMVQISPSNGTCTVMIGESKIGRGYSKYTTPLDGTCELSNSKVHSDVNPSQKGFTSLTFSGILWKTGKEQRIILEIGEREALRRAGGYLRSVRESLGKSQEDVERDTGVSTQAISQMERGHTHPKFKSICLIGEVYGLTPDQLAVLYGFWKPLSPPTDERITKLLSFLERAEPSERERILGLIEAGVEVSRRGFPTPKDKSA